MSGDDRDVIRRDRFAGGPARSFMSSLDADERIFEADLAVDRAHVIMLAETDIIDEDLAGDLLDALDTVESRGYDALPGGEDVHAAIETAVIEEVGPDGGSLHTARSRNDEVATCIRYRLRLDLLEAIDALLRARETMLEEASDERGTVLPGYTHLQPAQPTTVAHWLCGYEQALSRESARLFDLYDRVNRSPLGAAAFAGTTFPINRNRTAELLGFEGVLENTMEAVSTRDFLLEAAGALSSTSIVLSGIATDLTIFANRGLVELDDDFASTSSIMPQKKNPDTMELVRACTGDAIGGYNAIATSLKGLPRAYNRDLQRVTPHIWRVVDTVTEATVVTEGTVATLTWDVNALESAAGEGFTTATSVADTITRAGVPFRTAHEIVADVGSSVDGAPDVADIEEAVDRYVDLETIDLDRSALEHALDPLETVRQLDTFGGPAPSSIEAALDRGHDTLQEHQGELEHHSGRLETAATMLGKEVERYG